METSLARWLVSEAGREALELADEMPDPSSLAAATRLRRDYTPEQAAAVSRQTELRRRAVGKLGERARGLFLTADGLEQATRAPVAAWRAACLVAAGARRVIDLGCGIGADALAFADAGLEVVAVELDPATAVLAGANLGGRGEVLAGDAVALADDLLQSGDAVFIDPARRTARGRTWRVADVSPPWAWARERLVGRIGCLKAGPGISRSEIPSGLATVWVSERGDLVEAGLWSGIDRWLPGSRTAVLLPSEAELAVDETVVPWVGPVSGYLYEPDPAVIRAGGVGQVAAAVAGWGLAPGIAYVTADGLVETPLARAFAVDELMAWDERTLRAWVREKRIGVLEIKLRGIDVDPAVLRRRLKPSGPNQATVVLTPTAEGARALVVRRLN